jgi:drug/metabolite transporter (DMT)-like permease
LFFEEALIELESIQAQASPGLLFPCPEKSVLVIEDIEDNNQLLLQNVDYYGDSIDDNEQYGKGLMGLLSSPPRANYEEISKVMTKDQKEGDTVGVVVDDDDDNNDDEKRMQQEQEQKIVRSRWLLIVAAALYGTNFSVVKILGDDMSIPVGISTSLRFGLAAFATLPWLLDGVVTLPTFTSKPTTGTGTEEQTTMPTTMNSNYNDSDNSVSGKNTIDSRLMATLWGLEVGMWNSFGYVAQAVGLETTLASKSAFLCSMAVVIVPLLDWIAGKKLLSRQWIGAMMALVGVGFLELGGGGSGSSGGGGEIVAATTTATGVLSSLTSDITKGDILSMVQPFTFGLGFWRMEQAMKQYPKEAPRMTAAQLTAVFLSSVVYGLWSLDVFDGGVTGIVSSLADIGSSYPWHEWFTDPSVIFALFWTGCVTTALTIYMETLALEYLSAAETTLIFSTEPLWGTAFAVALMGEQLGMNAAVGGSLILAACIYSNLGINGVRDMSKKTVDRIISITAATTVGRERGTVIDDKNRKETSTR